MEMEGLICDVFRNTSLEMVEVLEKILLHNFDSLDSLKRTHSEDLERINVPTYVWKKLFHMGYLLCIQYLSLCDL
jgi:hypothetical protein